MGSSAVLLTAPAVGLLGLAPREDPPDWGEQGLALNPPCRAPGQAGTALDQRKAKQRPAQKLQSLWSSSTAADRKNNITAPSAPVIPFVPCPTGRMWLWDKGTLSRGLGVVGVESWCGAVGMHKDNGVSPATRTATLLG